MPLKREPCRNFQRGSCRYGDKCKFSHVTQQQQRSNVFGFGSQTGMHLQQTNTQHQKPNPFGFGVQNNAQPNGSLNFGGHKQPNTFKPFENKWIRSSSASGANALEKPANQSQAASHKCTDPESCKAIIVEDFERERPLWKLTCYGHFRFLPCDITGDVSYEELRATAYDDAKQGMPLQSIVERERSLLNSKVTQFDSLLRNPDKSQSNSAQHSPNPIPLASPSTASTMAQNSRPPAVSSFGQLGASLNMPFNVRPPLPSNNAFEQLQTSSTTSGAFGVASMPSQTAVPFGSQVSVQSSGSLSNGILNNGSSSLRSTSTLSSQIFNSTSNQSPIFSNGLGSSDLFGQAPTSSQLLENVQRETSNVCASIWLKDEWKLGEIPEEAPPDGFIK